MNTTYIAPSVELISVEIESGFAVSDTNGADAPGFGEGGEA